MASRVFQVRILLWTEAEREVCLPDAEVRECFWRVNIPRAPITAGLILCRTLRRRLQHSK